MNHECGMKSFVRTKEDNLNWMLRVRNIKNKMDWAWFDYLDFKQLCQFKSKIGLEVLVGKGRKF